MALRSMWDATSRRDLVRRLRRIQPSDRPRWGHMTAVDMLGHVAATLRFALGETSAGLRRAPPSWLKLAPVKFFFVYLLPFPKKAPSPPGFVVREEATWEAQLDAIEQLMERVAQRGGRPQPDWPEHPYFGRLSNRSWGVMGYKHTDHHLRQFGV